MTRGTRKIGLGVMGWADILLKLGIPYDSEEAIALAEENYGLYKEEARRKSMEIAKVKGVFLTMTRAYTKAKDKDRNATTTTIAPTGTLSIIAGVSKRN